MNRTSEYALTIVVPVFNEEDNIHNLEKALTEFIPVSKVKTCALFVDDGSKDGSLKLIQEVCSRNKDIFYISFSKNAGLSAAIKAGFDYRDLTQPETGYKYVTKLRLFLSYIHSYIHS